MEWQRALFVGVVLTVLADEVVGGDKPLAPRVLADLEDANAVTLRPHQAEVTRVPLGGGHALQITSEAVAPWPGVFVEPRGGKWDLHGFDAVEADVHNPQDVPVRVLLSINNPGADGRKACNTESATVPPGGRAKLVVPFGSWHGSPGHPLDLANIVSVQVLLDRAGRSHTFLVDNIRAVCFDPGEAATAMAEPFFKQLALPFGRGVNLGNALEAPHEGEWGVTLKEEYFKLIRAAGFDTVRIPVRWSAHAEQSPPYRIEAKFFDRVDWAVRQALQQGLVPVVNMHHYEEIFEQPDGHGQRFLALWRQIAEHYKDFPPELALELLNEPYAKLTAEKWNRLQAEAIAVVRCSNPTRLIVVGPADWNGINALPSLELPETDRRLVVTVHYYQPFQFTHQGADWVGPESRNWLGTKWIGTKEERQAVVRDLDKAVVWAVRHRRPMWLGEFGAYSKADLDSRARWTRFVATEALGRKMGIAYWEFCAGFGVYDPDRGRWIEPIKQALLTPVASQ